MSRGGNSDRCINTPETWSLTQGSLLEERGTNDPPVRLHVIGQEVDRRLQGCCEPQNNDQSGVEHSVWVRLVSSNYFYPADWAEWEVAPVSFVKHPQNSRGFRVSAMHRIDPNSGAASMNGMPFRAMNVNTDPPKWWT